MPARTKQTGKKLAGRKTVASKKTLAGKKSLAGKKTATGKKSLIQKLTAKLGVKRLVPKTRGKNGAAQAAPERQAPRITYSNLVLTEADHGIYDAAVGHFREDLGVHYKNVIN